MDGERRTLRGRTAGIPLSISTSAAAGSVAPDRNGRQSPHAFTERSIATPRDHYIRPRRDSYNPPPSSVYSRRSTVSTTPRPPPSTTESRGTPAYSTYGGDRDYEHDHDRDEPRFVQSPRSAIPPPSSSSAAFAQMDRDRDREPVRHSWDATQGSTIPIRPRRMSMLQQGDRPAERPRRGSLLQNEVPLERPRRSSMYQAETPSAPERNRRSGLMQSDFPPVIEKTRRQSFLQQQYNLHAQPQYQQNQQHSKNDMLLTPQEQAHPDRSHFMIPRPSSAAATNSSAGELIILKLTDLDWHADTVKIKLRPNTPLARVGEALMMQLGLSLSDFMVNIFQGDEALRMQHRVYEDGTYYYRLVGPGRSNDVSNDGPPRITFAGSASPSILPRLNEKTRMLEEQVQEGISVGEFRVIVAKLLGLDDSDRVLVEACNGMRVGAIEGEDWRLIDIANFWLCSKFRIFVIRPGRMISIRLFGTTRRYLFHSSLEDDDEYDEDDEQEQLVSPTVLKARFIKQVITGTHITQQSQIFAEPHDLYVYNTSNPDSEWMSWGSLIDIEIPTNLRMDFLAQEEWILGGTMTCEVCFENRHQHEFVPLTAECNHAVTMCTTCANKWLATEIGAQIPTAIVCPTCKATPTPSHVRKWARPSLWERFDMLLTTSALRNIPNFYWCIRPGCLSGQIHLSQCPQMECDELCDSPVELRSGCNHITCSCGTQWCYLCKAIWTNDAVSGILHCKHRRGCAEERNNPMYRPHDDVSTRFRHSDDDNDDVFVDDNDDYVHEHNRGRAVRHADHRQSYDLGPGSAERGRWSHGAQNRTRDRSTVPRDRSVAPRDRSVVGRDRSVPAHDRNGDRDGERGRDPEPERDWAPRGHEPVAVGARRPPITRGGRRPIPPPHPETPVMRPRRGSVNIPRRPRPEDGFF
ncbi:hypothetical protein BROUX41_005590 [Berkeleyomyces rouxiae]